MPELMSLKTLFEPHSIAVIGASRKPEAVGYAVLHNLLEGGYQGKIFPINPKADQIENLKAYPSILEVPESVELAVIVVPRQNVPETLRLCAQKKVQAAVVISAGFKEVGGEGVALEKEIIEISKSSGISVLGPNCLGIINACDQRMNASFARTMPRAGNIAFVSQSGALCTAILDYAKGQGLGFSKFVSLGNKACLNEVDMLRYLKEDSETDVVLMYVEDLVNGREFMELAREMTGDADPPKPILVIKSGRTAEGAKAASSHTGSLMGSDEVYDALFIQCGVLRMDSVEEMFNLAVGFANQPLPKGKRVAIVTNAGGPGIMTTDACIRSGLEIAQLLPSTQEALRKVLPQTASVSNPVDVIGDAQHDRYEQALKIVAQDPNVDSLIVILTPQAMTTIEETAEVIVRLDQEIKIPMMACFMGIVDVSAGVKILEDHHIPHYRFPEAAARTLGAMVRYQEWIKRPRTKVKKFEVDSKRVKAVIQETLQQNETVVPIHKALEIFQAYGLPILPFSFIKSEEEISQAVKKLGFPLVMKVVSAQIIHKFDFGGVKLNLQNEKEVREAYREMMRGIAQKAPQAKIDGVLLQKMADKGKEVILGMTRDPLFGPILMFGLGGVYVETLKDVAFRLAPVRELSAQHMIESIRSFPILKGIRGEKPSDLEAIVNSIQRLSQLACDQSNIKEMDINPLMVYPEKQGALVLDARIILRQA